MADINEALTREVIELLAASKREKKAKQKERYDVVRLFFEGHSRYELAELFHLTYWTVAKYIVLYKKGGLNGLIIKKQTGQPKKLTQEQENVLFTVISSSSPDSEGLGHFANWTAPLACAWVMKRYGVSFSERGIRDVFYRIGLSYTRPTYTLQKADPQKQAEFKKTFEGLKKTR